MSFFSLSLSSSRKRLYRDAHYGSVHYQRKGLLGHLFDAIVSRSGPVYYVDPHAQAPYPPPYNPQAPYPQGQNPQAQAPYPQGQIPPHQAQNTPHVNALLCDSCNAQIPAGSKFCLNCGKRVAESAFCPNCGENVPLNARFCQKCGIKING